LNVFWTIALSGFSHIVFAHPSSITFYDRGGDIEITGPVTKLSWANPHVRMMVSVKDKEENV